MIRLMSAKTSVLGDVRKCEEYSLGYTDPVGMTRSTSVVLRKFAEEGMSSEAKLFHDVQPANWTDSPTSWQIFLAKSLP